MEKITQFKIVRKMKGLTQGDVAKLVGVTQVSVYILEKKGVYDTRTAVKYGKALGVNPILLLEGLS